MHTKKMNLFIFGGFLESCLIYRATLFSNWDGVMHRHWFVSTDGMFDDTRLGSNKCCVYFLAHVLTSFWYQMGVIDYIRINSNSRIIVHKEKRLGNTFIDLFFLVVMVLHECSQLRTNLGSHQRRSGG